MTTITYLHRYSSSEEEAFKTILDGLQANSIVRVGWKDLLLLLHITICSLLSTIIKYSKGIHPYTVMGLHLMSFSERQEIISYTDYSVYSGHMGMVQSSTREGLGWTSGSISFPWVWSKRLPGEMIDVPSLSVLRGIWTIIITSCFNSSVLNWSGSWTTWLM